MGIFDDIQLPEEDKNKSADIPKDNEEDNSSASASASDNKPTNQNAGDDNSDKKDNEPDKPATPEPDKKDDKLSDQPVTPENGKDTPFHQHPDWIKREEQLKAKELEVAKLQGQIEVLEKKATPESDIEVKKVERQKASAVAEQKYLEKVKGGWNPKDHLEQTRVFSELFEEALDEREKEKAEQSKQEQAKLEELQTKIRAEIDIIYKDSGIVSSADKEAAEGLALQWAKDGTANWSTKTLALAVKQLKLEGKIGKVETPAVVPPATPEPDKKQDVLKKIQRSGGNSGQGSGAQKKSYKRLHGTSLDDIVSQQSEALG